MSKYNKKAYDDETYAIWQAWVKANAPLTYIYAPSKRGKTTLLGSIFKHAARTKAKPVFFIDADQGAATIEEYAYDERVCTLRSFDQMPDKQYGWFLSQLVEARSADCSAIVIEGIVSIHAAMVSEKIEKLKDATGNALRRAYIEPAMKIQAAFEQVRKVKQCRVALEIGVPIFVSLNSKKISQKKDEPDSPKMPIPAFSDNVIEVAMRSSDAFLELTRDPSGTTLLTKSDSHNEFRGMRHKSAADAIQRELNLDLPGFLACWATNISEKVRGVSAKLDKRDAKKSTATKATTKPTTGAPNND